MVPTGQELTAVAMLVEPDIGADNGVIHGIDLDAIAHQLGDATVVLRDRGLDKFHSTGCRSGQPERIQGAVSLVEDAADLLFAGKPAQRRLLFVRPVQRQEPVGNRVVDQTAAFDRGSAIRRGREPVIRTHAYGQVVAAMHAGPEFCWHGAPCSMNSTTGV
jgi:hypothetical protein